MSNVLQTITSCVNASDIDTVLVDGKIVVEKGRLNTIDEDELLRKCQEMGNQVGLNLLDDINKGYTGFLPLSKGLWWAPPTTFLRPLHLYPPCLGDQGAPAKQAPCTLRKHQDIKSIEKHGLIPCER